MIRYCPRQQLRCTFPQETVSAQQAVPGNRKGGWERGDRIYLDRDLTQVGRRCQPHLKAREEQIADEIAARRLITLDDLVDTLLWTDTRTGSETVEELWSNAHMLNVRLRTLPKAERATVGKQIRRRKPW